MGAGDNFNESDISILQKQDNYGSVPNRSQADYIAQAMPQRSINTGMSPSGLNSSDRQVHTVKGHKHGSFSMMETRNRSVQGPAHFLGGSNGKGTVHTAMPGHRFRGAGSSDYNQDDYNVPRRGRSQLTNYKNNNSYDGNAMN